MLHWRHCRYWFSATQTDHIDDLGCGPSRAAFLRNREKEKRNARAKLLAEKVSAKLYCVYDALRL